MTKKVYKYATGEEVPEGAVYLCTQVEKEYELKGEGFYTDSIPDNIKEKNRLVWHYFLVDV